MNAAGAISPRRGALLPGELVEQGDDLIERRRVQSTEELEYVPLVKGGHLEPERYRRNG